MGRRRAGNPRNGRRKRRKTMDYSGDDWTSDSDYVLDQEEEEEEEDEVQEIPFPYPQPPRLPQRKRAARRNKKKKGDENLQWAILEEEYEKWLDDRELERAVPNVDDHQPHIVATADPSPDILLPLLRFQKEWLLWALKQEESEAGGGILADEMGMGKTIQAIALVLTARFLRSRWDSVMASCSSSSSLPKTTATLVICPVVAVIQWVGEIEQHTERGSVRVLVYHGHKRSSIVYDFNNYDFVLTTYSTVENDFRKYIMPPKEKCQWCEKMFYPKKMKIHLKYFCGPNAQKTNRQSKQVKKKKKVDWASHDLEVGEGNEKKKKKKGVCKMKDDESVGAPRGKSVLHSVKWERIILDEAHSIKDRHCNTARAVFALESKYKWALSGTPLQNRVGELYSLVRFLQIYPYSLYFCKDCDCKILDYSSSQTCDRCPHAATRHFCWWNKYIAKPIQARAKSDEGQRAIVLLKDKVLKSIVLRRTKQGRAADLALPPRIVSLRRDSLDKNEQEFYEALYTQSRVQFDTYVMAGTLMNNYAHIFDLLTRLRQAVDHPYLVIYSKTAEVPEVSSGSREDIVQDDCSICHDPAEDAVVTSCNHVFCKACLINYSATLGKVSCPSCSKPLTVDLNANNAGEKISTTTVKGYKHSGILNRIRIEDFKTSTKIDALREEIRNMVEGDSSSKGIVFSQFTSFLDLINFSLQRSGIKCVQLVGSMSLAEREKAIKTFTEDGDCRIFLMSLKAGGVALNLTVASHVFLMDPWWNPAVERQAQDRIHRIGQYKPIKTVRFVIEDTIEERILRLQEKKELVFEGTIGDSSAAMAKLTEADLRFLFHV